jgi:hypothetical protein
MGAMANLVNLSLDFNAIGVKGMQAFTLAIASGALGSLKELNLNFNQIGDDGMVAFAEALKPNPSNPMGAMVLLAYVNLGGNQIGNEGMAAFSKAIAIGALAKLTRLQLTGNQIGDHGMKAFASAIASGAMARGAADPESARKNATMARSKAPKHNTWHCGANGLRRDPPSSNSWTTAYGERSQLNGDPIGSKTHRELIALMY